MKKAALIMMAVFFAVAIAATAFGFGRGPGYGPCPKGGFQGPAGFDLTEEQRAKIKQIQEEQWKEMKPLQDQTFTKRDEIRKLWLEANPDRAKIMAALKEMQILRDQMKEKAKTFRLRLAEVLTPEQREKIESLRERRGPMHERDFGKVFGFTQEFGPRHGFRPMYGFGFEAPGRVKCVVCPELPE